MPEPAAGLADSLDAKVLLSVLAQVTVGDFTARMRLARTGLAGTLIAPDPAWVGAP